jgi:hypothetical protein
MQNTINNIKFKTMKTRKKLQQQLKVGLALLGFVLFSTTPALAHNGKINGIEEAEKQIKNHVKLETPIAPIHQTQKVEVVFTLNEKGVVNFALAKTENQSVKQEIEKQFSELHFSSLKADVAYSIVINFKTL